MRGVLHLRRLGVFVASHDAGIQVVAQGVLVQIVELHIALFITGKGQRRARRAQKTKEQGIARGLL